jgi:ATP-dependent DNA helicase RecQ
MSDTPLRVLHDRFGLEAFRPGQERVITTLLEGRPSLAVFPTGGGKSLCYQLPAVLLPGLTLVVSPLIALMKDQVDALTRRGIDAARLDSSLGLDEVKDIQRRVKDGRLRLLYVAPERFANERFLELLQQTRVSLFAVDEAHSISEWGHNFRPDYLKLTSLASLARAERVLALTATATPAVVSTICQRFGIADHDVVITGFYRHNLELRTTAVDVDDKDRALRAALEQVPAGPAIVYVTLQRTAERVAAMLTASGRPARAYHAGLSADERSATQEAFMASPTGLVVATIAFGMGIDKADVRAVLHYELPKSLEGYSQEIGRAGRDGLPSVVHLLASRDDALVLQGFACGDTPTLAALTALTTDLSGRGDAFELDLLALGDAHDLRPLVLRTALTHLELLGVIKQGTPVYASYQVKPLIPVPDIVARFSGDKGAFIGAIFGAGKTGRIWTHLSLDDVAVALGQDRQRIMRALDFLAEQGLAEVRTADVRHRYTRPTSSSAASSAASSSTPAALAALLHERFVEHETREVARLQQVVDLVESDTCQTLRLVKHFTGDGSRFVVDDGGSGADRQKCGHCTLCLSGRPTRLPASRPAPDFSAMVDVDLFRSLCLAHPRALLEPRQQARFLCGLGSPATTKAKLSRHALNGVLERHRFHDVLAWREAEARA